MTKHLQRPWKCWIAFKMGNGQVGMFGQAAFPQKRPVGVLAVRVHKRTYEVLYQESVAVVASADLVPILTQKVL